jgi:hypothetical protein
MEQNFNRSSQNLGVAALITAIVTFIMAIIPCVGVLAIIPGVVAVILAFVGLSRANQNGRGMVIAALIIGIVASLISLSQWAFIGKMASNKDYWKGDFEKVLEDVKGDIFDGLDKGDFSIKIESDGETVEIKSSVNRRNLEEKLEKLEKADTPVVPKVPDVPVVPDTVKK